MEVATCVQEISSHAVSLLASLNLQREQAQYCDCVVIQRLNPGQLYPAHRCILSASSPVLASILSSSGALVELQDPCLSDSVLAILLDYIYTGALSYTQSQQYNNLLSAARHLQMDELQETLKAWRQTEVNSADNTNASTEDMNNSESKTVNCFSKHLPLSQDCSVNSLQREDHQNVSNEAACNEIDCSQETYLTPQDVMQNVPCTTEAHVVSKVGKVGCLSSGLLKDQCHSIGTEPHQTWRESTEEEPVRIVEDRRSLNLCHSSELQEERKSELEKTQQLCLAVESKAEEEQNRKEEDNMQIRHSSLPHLSTSELKDNVCPLQCPSSSSSSLRPCCGAVPVIRHSSRASMPFYHPVSQASVSSSSLSGPSDSIVEGITINDQNVCEAQNQDHNKKDHFGTQSWDYKDSSDQCGLQDLCYQSNSTNTDQLIAQNDEHRGNGLSHIVNHKYNNAHCHSFQDENDPKDLCDDSMPQNRFRSHFTRGKRYKTEFSFEVFPSKYQRLDCSDCHNNLKATTVTDQSVHSHDLTDKVPLPVQDTDTESASHCEYLHPEGEVKEEHSYSSQFSTEVERQDSHLYKPRTDWYPNLHRAETSTKEDSDSKKTPTTEKRHRPSTPSALELGLGDVTGSHYAFEQRASIELENFSSQIPVDNNTSDAASSVIRQSYRGHLYYHCLPQNDTHVSHRDPDHTHPHPGYPDHSDQSSDGEDVGTFTSQVSSPLRQHFARGTTEQVLLLDISSKPAELLVSYKHRSDRREDWIRYDHTDTFESGSGNTDREQWDEAGETQITAESFVEADSKSLVGEANVEERKPVGKAQNSPGVEVLHKVRTVEAGNQTTTLTVCSPPSVPEFVQGSVSSTLSVCIPSSLSGSMPTNVSAHLSTPVHHPFQCYLCDRSFSQRGSLNRHVRSHLGVRPFPCPRCPMTFSRQYRVTEHMRVHQRFAFETDFQKSSTFDSK